MEGWAERNPRTVLMVVDVPVKQSLSFCAEALSAKIEQKQECVLLQLPLHYSYYLKPQDFN